MKWGESIRVTGSLSTLRGKGGQGAADDVEGFDDLALRGVQGREEPYGAVAAGSGEQAVCAQRVDERRVVLCDEGDVEALAAHALQKIGVLRDEVLERMEHLDRAVYTGFVMPRLDAVYDAGGAIADVALSYPRDLAAQMLEYSAATLHWKEHVRNVFPRA